MGGGSYDPCTHLFPTKDQIHALRGCLEVTVLEIQVTDIMKPHADVFFLHLHIF